VAELSQLEAHSPLRNEAHPAGSCPECSEPMQTFFVEVGQVAVDVCQRHGTWLDTGELARIARGEGPKAPSPPAATRPGLPSEEEGRENTRRLEALVSAPTEGTYLKGLRVMPGAIATSIAEGLSSALEEEDDDDGDAWHHYYDGENPRRRHSLIVLVFEYIASLARRDD
jgi:Zn-finger nucleic acid-binding protein